MIPYNDEPFVPSSAYAPPVEPAAAPPPHAAWTDVGSRGWWANRERLASLAFVAGLAGGVLILLGAFSAALFLTVAALLGDGPAAWDADGWFPGVAVGMALWGLVTGGLVLLAALRLREAERATAIPGVLMLVGGLLSFFALGGFLIGGLVAIAGGVLGIAAARDLLPERHARRGRAPIS